jgi:hypothetical protein
MIIQIIDNTADMLGGSNTADNRQENSFRLTIPNLGIAKNGDNVHYFHSNLRKLNTEHYYIPDSSIFLKNGDLIKNGIIVKKVWINKTFGMNLEDEEKYFICTQSQIEEVSKGDVVIVNARTAYRFNYMYREYFYVSPANIILIMKPMEKEFHPGPGKLLLKEAVIDHGFGITQGLKYAGDLNNCRYHFNEAEYEIEIDGINHYVVKESEIKLWSFKND